MNVPFNIIFLIIIFVSSLELFSLSAKELTLDDYLEEVLQSNLAIEAAQWRAKAQRHRIVPGSSWEDPFVAVGLDEIPFKGGGAKIRRYQISQSIPFPGRPSARAEMATKRAEIAESESRAIVSEIKVLATQAYLRAVYNQQALALSEKIKVMIAETTASSKARYRTGDANHHEWLLSKLEMSLLEVEQIRLRRLQKSLTASLNELRNRSVDTPIELEHENLLKSSLVVPEANLELQPELLAMKSQKKAAEIDLRLARFSFAPDFVIQAMAMEPVMKDEMAEPSNWGVMIGMTMPLLFWDKQSEKIAAAENEKKAAQANYQILENRLNSELLEARQQWQTALDVVKLYKTDVLPLTEIAVKSARSAYAGKLLPLKQFLEALRSQKTQELEFLAAQMDLIVARTRITQLLADPPVIKFAPGRPSLFGAGMEASMSAGMEEASNIKMGDGLKAPSPKDAPADSGAADGMGGM